MCFSVRQVCEVMPVATNWTVEMKLAAGTLCMQTLLTSSSVLLQTENVNIAQSELHEYDSMAGGPSAATAAAAARRTCCSAVPNCRALAAERLATLT